MHDDVPFRHRAKEVSRIEAFSDIVFGFALTLVWHTHYRFSAATS